MELLSCKQQITHLLNIHLRSVSVLSDVGGKVNLTATFLLLLTPQDLKRQSLVMVYLHVDVVSADGASHHVAVYVTDISAGNEASLDPDILD